MDHLQKWITSEVTAMITARMAKAISGVTRSCGSSFFIFYQG